MYLFYVVVYLVIYLGTLFLQILMSLLVVKNKKKKPENTYIYLFVKNKSHVTFRTGHGCWSKGCETPAAKFPLICSRKLFSSKFCYVCVFISVYLSVLCVADPSHPLLVLY